MHKPNCMQHCLGHILNSPSTFSILIFASLRFVRLIPKRTIGPDELHAGWLVVCRELRRMRGGHSGTDGGAVLEQLITCRPVVPTVSQSLGGRVDQQQNVNIPV